MSIEAIKQAIEALDIAQASQERCRILREKTLAAYPTLRAAITEAALQQLTDVQQEIEQETVALKHKHEWFTTGVTEPGQYRCIHCGAWAKEIDPPRREWVGLTDEEVEGCIDESFEYALDRGNIPNRYVTRYARAIEAKLKEKNNG